MPWFVSLSVPIDNVTLQDAIESACHETMKKAEDLEALMAHLKAVHQQIHDVCERARKAWPNIPEEQRAAFRARVHAMPTGSAAPEAIEASSQASSSSSSSSGIKGVKPKNACASHSSGTRAASAGKLAATSAAAAGATAAGATSAKVNSKAVSLHLGSSKILTAAKKQVEEDVAETARVQKMIRDSLLQFLDEVDLPAHAAESVGEGRGREGGQEGVQKRDKEGAPGSGQTDVHGAL